MPKEITCEILKDYFSIDDSDEWSTKICEVKWNGRSPKGYDIRKYNKETEKLFKGITISYEGFRDLIYNSIENGLVDVTEVEKRIETRKGQIVNMSDFQAMFTKMNSEMSKYTRDNHGVLRDNTGKIVISKRLKKRGK